MEKEIDLRAAVTVRPKGALAWKAEFSEFWSEIEVMEQELSGLDVLDAETAEKVVAIGTSAKGLGRDLDERRKQVIKEAQDFVGTVNNFCRPWTEKLKTIVNASTDRVKVWRERERIRLLQEEVAQKEQYAKIQEQLREEAEAAGVSPGEIQDIAPVLSQKPKTIRSESGSASFAKRWTWGPEEKCDLSKVPLEYLAIDRPKVTQAVKQGIREIPGIPIYEVEDVKFRT